MPANDLVIRAAGKDIFVDGIVDVAADLKPYVGVGEGSALRDFSAGEMTEDLLKSATLLSLMGGSLVDDKHVKFAHPIMIKAGAGAMEASVKQAPKTKGDLPLASPKLERIFAPQSEPMRDNAPKPDLNRTNDIENTKRDAGHAKSGGIVVNVTASDLEKSASISDFSERLIDSIQAHKVDGTDLGLDLPMKVHFDSEMTKNIFMGLGKKSAKKAANRDAAVDKVAEALASTGMIRTPLSGLLERLKGK